MCIKREGGVLPFAFASCLLLSLLTLSLRYCLPLPSIIRLPLPPIIHPPLPSIIRPLFQSFILPPLPHVIRLLDFTDRTFLLLVCLFFALPSLHQNWVSRAKTATFTYEHFRLRSLSRTYGESKLITKSMYFSREGVWFDCCGGRGAGTEEGRFIALSSLFKKATHRLFIPL